MSQPGVIRLVVVDDHPSVRRSLRLVLQAAADVDVVGVAAEGEEALRVCDALHPAVVLIDFHLARREGVETIRALQGQRPRPRVLVLTADDDMQCIQEALGAGACDYVLKQCGHAELLAAIRIAADRLPTTTQIAEGDAPPQVLVAAASRRVRATLRVLLETAGYQVSEAADGVETIDLLLASPSRLVVLLDLLLPRLSGHRVLLQTGVEPLLARHVFAVLGTTALSAERLITQIALLLTEQAIPVLHGP